eukprot:Sspe_Gene.117379::Locus_108515_Transcript_1_1_Confidence_1.000_Length_674::g.117379::m.117379
MDEEPLPMYVEETPPWMQPWGLAAVAVMLITAVVMGRALYRHSGRQEVDEGKAETERWRQRRRNLRGRNRRQEAADDEDTREQELAEKEKRRASAREERERREEEAARRREERKQQEAKECERWCAEMQVEHDGHEEDEEASRIRDFLREVMECKVLELEKVAAKYRLTVETLVKLLENLEEQGRISGVFDDNGKYIRITPD